MTVLPGLIRGIRVHQMMTHPQATIWPPVQVRLTAALPFAHLLRITPHDDNGFLRILNVSTYPQS